MKTVFIKCPHPEMIEAVSYGGFDGCVIDMEHTPLSPRDLYPLILAAERNAIKPIVRVPSHDEHFIKWAIDLGVQYIQVPHISSPSHISFIEKLAYFNPIGERGLCRFVRASNFSNIPADEYIKKANRETKIIYQIEGVEGIKMIRDIIDSISQPSIIFIGPYDLSQSLNRPGDIWHDDVVKLMLSVVEECSKKNIEVGTFTDTKDGIKFWQEKGVSLIEYGSDLNLFIEASKELLD